MTRYARVPTTYHRPGVQLIWLLLLLIVTALLNGCRKEEVTPLPRATAPPAMAATPVPSHTSFASASPTSSPSPSPIVPRSPAPTATSNIIIYGVDTPDPAATTPAPSPTPAPLVVASPVTVRRFDTLNGLIAWSPARDEFAYSSCTMPRENPIFALELYRADAPDFVPIDLAPDQEGPDAARCAIFAYDHIWTPDGEQLVYASAWATQPDVVDFFQIDRAGGPPTRISPPNGLFRSSMVQWIDDEVLLLSSYAGGGSRTGHLLDRETGEVIDLGGLFSGGFFGAGADFVALVPYSFHPDRYVAAMALPGRPLVITPEPFPLLERSVWPGTDFQSLFVTWWNPAANEMAIVTWSDALWTAARETSIRIWDIDGGELRSFFPGGQSASLNAAGTLAAVESSETIMLSSDGRSAGLQPVATGDARPYVHLVETDTGHVLRSIPSSSFVPRSEYFSTATGPLWHPVADRFIYRGRDGELHLYDVDTGRSQHLTRSGGQRLSNLAWSPSGRYLSAQLCGDGKCQTLLFDLKP